MDAFPWLESNHGAADVFSGGSLTPRITTNVLHHIYAPFLRHSFDPESPEEMITRPSSMGIATDLPLPPGADK
jgi:hypothetical protein